MPTLLMKNAAIIDRTGRPAYVGHLLVAEDRIRDTLAPQESPPTWFIFNSGPINDTASAEGADRPSGIRHVFINSRQVVSGGAYRENARWGRALRR